MNVPGQAQVAVGRDLAAPIAPLSAIAVPDVNMLGILDQSGPNAAAWPKITNTGQKTALQQLGKALFWDMQVGGDGIQSCASCHYHAGADNRKTNQMSPGLKKTHGGSEPVSDNPDTVQDLFPNPNATLTASQFPFPNGLPVSEAALVGAGSTADQVDGTSGVPGSKPAAVNDVNDVVSSQGVRLGTYHGVTTNRVDTATLATSDPGFNSTFSSGSFTTVRRVEPRNSPTAINAVYNLRNFWDGRADLFFNGVNPLGFRDPDARVKVYDGSNVVALKLRTPFSSLASQAVGPIESPFEMVFDGRPHRDLGKKLLRGAQPLAGQMVSCADSLLGGLTNCTTPGTTNRGLTSTTYSAMIQAIFDQRFWGNGSGGSVCLNSAGALDTTCPGDGYTLMEWNFAMFFGLAVQAYEATLTTERTMVDLLVGGIATGTVTNGAGRQLRSVNVAGLPLQGCIAAVALNNNAAQQAVATNLCTQHYAAFIHPRAVAGSESLVATGNVVPAGTSIGGCTSRPTVTSNGTAWCNTATNLAQVRASLLAIDRGMGRFFAGATGCSICHFNPEFTGATVAALTGFGAAPLPPLPPGQLRKIAPEVPMERMIAFNGGAAVYDSGFYNLGVRPTPEDLSLGSPIGGVPLAFTKLAELIEAGPANALAPYNSGQIAEIAAELAVDPGTGLNQLLIPTSPTNLTPRPFTLALACGPGLVGNGNGRGEPNNNPNNGCVPTVIPGERLLRNGAFKATGLRNVKFTGPYMHNGAKLNLRQVVEFYKTAGHFVNLNFNNLDAGLRIFNLGVQDEAALVEMMETGLTDWRLAHEEGKFDHPEICVPHGHDSATGKTVLAGIPAVGSSGSSLPLQTFEEQVRNIGTVATHAHTLTDTCTVIDSTVGAISVGGLSTIDVPPAPVVP